MITTILTVLVVGVWIAMEVRASWPRTPAPPLEPEDDIFAPHGRTPASLYRTPTPAGPEPTPAGPEPTPAGPEPTQAPAQDCPPKRGRWLECPFCGSKYPGVKFERCAAVNAAECTDFGQPHVNQRCTSCGVALGSVFPSETVSGYPWSRNK